MTYWSFRCLYAFFLFLSTGGALAQSPNARPYSPVEISLVSDRTYTHPVRDVEVRLSIAGPNGETVQILAFWNGGHDFLARFAPGSPGRWRYCTSASDVSNNGLHGVCGEIDVAAAETDNPFLAKGWPAVASDRRHLTYANGEPLFLLIEAAMEITWKSTLEEVEAYVADRSEKGFNVAWVVPMSHQYFYPDGVTNEYGEVYFVNRDYSLLNPRYFDYLDEIVNRMNEAGIAVLLNPVWGRMASVYENSVHQRSISLDDALLHARYIGARYAGHNVLWLVAGDANYPENEDRAYWNQFAVELDRASGGSHLMTAHATGFHGSHHYFEKSEWLDFHTYTPSHIVEAFYTADGAVQARNAEPKRPVLNIEYHFEDLYDQFWLFWDDTTNAVRISSADVRMGAYQGILSGAIAGTSYGANGIWQWGTPSTLHGFGIRRTAMEALHFEGSDHMRVLTELMKKYTWYSLTEFDRLVLSYSSSHRVVAAAGEDVLLAYLPRQTDYVTLHPRTLSKNLIAEWINPTTGSAEDGEFASWSQDDPLILSPPDARDWLLVLQNAFELPNENQFNISVGIFPNPSHESTNVNVTLGEPGIVSIHIYDILGRRVLYDKLENRGLRTVFKLEGLADGVYLYRIEHESASTLHATTGSFVRTK